ncbi:MAG: hypothetical protein K1X78_08380 [Verrucomicrobiaceae bacterium]|nr:hypothetical protein [Verrucomicrobiaceae bacterium]
MSPIPQQSGDAVPAQLNAAAPGPAQLPAGFSSKTQTSTSASGQFKVYGRDLQTRSPFTARCDEVAEKLNALLHDDERWVLPVVVALKSGAELRLAGPAVSTTISQIADGGFHLQVNVQLRPDLRTADFDAELTRILLAERILRNKREITTKRSMVLPEWLLTGVLQATNFRERSKPGALFAAVFKSGKIYGIDEILDAAPGQLDSLSRTIYETSCCALVLALLDQNEGTMRMRKFISLLAVDSRDDRKLLNFCFPNLALSASSLNKWWSLQMASLATPTVFETLGPTETRQALSQALMLRYETTPDAMPKTSNPALAAGDEPPSAGTPAEEKKRSMISRLLGLGSGTTADKTATDPKPAVARAKAKPQTESAASKPEVARAKTEGESSPGQEETPEAKKRGFLSRMFGTSSNASDEPPKEEKKEMVPSDPPPPLKQTKATAGDKPATNSEEKEEAPAAEVKKPGFFGRMFGGGSSGAEASEQSPPEENKEKKKDKATAASGETAKPAPKKADTPAATGKPGVKNEEPEKPAKKPAAGGPDASEDSPEPKKRGFFGRMLHGGDSSKKEKSDDEKPGDRQEEKSGPKKKTSKDGAAVDEGVPAAASLLADDWRRVGRDLLASVDAWTRDICIVWPALADGRAHEVKLKLPFGRKKTTPSPEDAKPPEEKPDKAEKEPDRKKPEKAEPAPEKKAEPVSRPEPKTEPKPRTKSSAAKSEHEKLKAVPVAIPLEDYANILKRKDRAEILDRTAVTLHKLLPRAHVLFRPVINEYLEVVADLRNGKTKDVDARLAALRERASKTYDLARAVRDHLDAYEANETRSYSGMFDDFLRLPDFIDKELPVRDDPLSRYLDAMDLEFGR